MHYKPGKFIKDVVLAACVLVLIQPKIFACPVATEANLPKNSVTKKPATTKPKAHSLQDPCLTDQEKQQDYLWMEEFHQTVSNSVFQSAVWFDNFFIDDNSEQTDPYASARIKLGWEPKARDWGEFKTRFRIKVKLPHFKDKVDLIFSDDDDETNQSHLPLESVNTDPQADEEKFSASVRYTHSQNERKFLASRIGISGGDIFAQTKHKRLYSWDNTHSFKFEPSIYYFLNDGLGAKLLLEYNYQLNEKSQYRINYSVRASEEFSGLRWKHGFYKLTQLDQHAASVTGLQVQGERNGERGFVIDKYTLSYRYRFNALKSWLFFEVEPFLEWPENEDYKTTPGLALRVEGFFYKE